MLKAIACAKKKNDRLDATKISDLLRCNLLPRCYVAPPANKSAGSCDFPGSARRNGGTQPRGTNPSAARKRSVRHA